MKNIQIPSIRAPNTPLIASTSANGSIGNSKKSQIPQSTATIPEESVFTSPVQPIPNEPLNAGCFRPNTRSTNPSPNVLSDFYLTRPLTVIHGPYSNHQDLTGKCYPVPPVCEILTNPRPKILPPFVNLQPSPWVQAVLSPLYPKRFLSETSEMPVIRFLRHPSLEYSVNHNHCSMFTNALYPEN